MARKSHRLLDEAHLGRAISKVLDKAEVSLKGTIARGTILEYGSGIKEWHYKQDTRFSRFRDLGNGHTLHYDYFTVALPSGFSARNIISMDANLVAEDALLARTASIKVIENGKKVRLEYSGMSNETLTDAKKQVSVSFRIMIQE